MRLHDLTYAANQADRAGDYAKAEKLRAEYADRYLAESAVNDDGVMRWISNGSVVPDEIIEWSTLDAETKRTTMEARVRETREFLAEYRRLQPAEPSDEERAEARAAHGEGVELVDVITGRRYTT